MLEKFKKMSLTRKVAVGLLFLSTLGMLVNGELLGALIAGALACYLAIRSERPNSDTAYVEQCIEKFEEMSLTRKLVVGFLGLSSLAMLVDGGFFGALIIGAIAYYLTITSGEKKAEAIQTYNEESDDEYLSRQQEDDDAYWMQKEEERIQEERRIIDEGLPG